MNNWWKSNRKKTLETITVAGVSTGIIFLAEYSPTALMIFVAALDAFLLLCIWWGD